jgi:hypothetical protein
MDLKDGWIKKLIFNGLEACCFHNHFALTISAIKIVLACSTTERTILWLIEYKAITQDEGQRIEEIRRRQYISQHHLSSS